MNFMIIFSHTIDVNVIHSLFRFFQSLSVGHSPSGRPFPTRLRFPHLVQVVQQGLMDLLIRLQVTGRRGFVAQQHPLRQRGPVGGWMGPQRAVR